MLLIVVLIFVSLFGLSRPAEAQVVGFEEEFALATDRGALLERLIPGTEEHYYYSCLHAQHIGEREQVPALLAAWQQRYGRTSRFETIELRQLLLDYPTQPAATMRALQRRLGVSYGHVRIDPDRPPTFPTALDPASLDPQMLLERELAQNPNDASGLSDRGLWHLASRSLDPRLRRALLARLELPDYPNLVSHVVADLQTPQSPGFGSLPIHGLLTLEQLDETAAQVPELLQNASFLTTYLNRLAPPIGVDLRVDPEAEQAYLERLVAFTQRLRPSQNALRVHALYHRLAFDRRQGRYDRARFLEYLKLPRRADYMDPDYLNRREFRSYANDLASEHTGLLERVASDWPLVRDYLLHFLTQDSGPDAFAPYVRESTLRALFVEAKVTAGLGELERWYTLLDDPNAFERLKQRVDLEFAPTSRTWFRSNEPVSLELDIKNVSTLIVKIYEINSLNYYRQVGRELTPTFSLDGLVPNHERVFEYADPSWRRERRRFDLPELAGPGDYIVDFIGGGIASRAVIQKGRLRFVERHGGAGHVFRVYDDLGGLVPNARLWLAGHEYSAQDSGDVVVPYSTKPGIETIVLSRGDGPGAWATLDRFEHLAEQYVLEADFHLEPESLITGTTAPLIVRPRLSVQGAPVTVKRLDEVRLVVEVTDLDGVSSVQTIPEFLLYDDRLSVHELRVPPRTLNVSVRLEGKIQSLSQGEKVPLSHGHSFTFNGLDVTSEIQGVFLTRDPSGNRLEVRGKSGEPRPGQAVHIELSHRDFQAPIAQVLQTDPLGRIDLGALSGINSVSAKLPNGQVGDSWDLTSSQVSIPATVHARVGEVVRIPYAGAATATSALDFALFALCREASQYRHDGIEHLAVVGRALEVRDLGVGEYRLVLKELAQSVLIRITDSPRVDRHWLTLVASLETSPASAPNIARVNVTNDEVLVGIDHPTAGTRVHVVAHRFADRRSLGASLRGPIAGPRRDTHALPEATYLTGRELSDEMRYVLDRQRSRRFPGNPLARPSLLMHRWSIRETLTGRTEGKAGGTWRGQRGRRASEDESESIHFYEQRSGIEGSAAPNLDFLPEPALVLVNLTPDANGNVRVARSALGGRTFIQAVAVDGLHVAERELWLESSSWTPKDLTLPESLDAAQHFAEQKRVVPVRAGDRLTIERASSATFETYADIGSVYRLYLTLSGNATLAEFAFVADWPSHTAEKKRSLYSRYACHELNLFLWRKDPEFFAAIVLPTLRNKKDPTFLDRFFLDADLVDFIEPWAYAQLNALEKALLASRLPGEAAATARHLQDRHELMPRDPEDWLRRFRTALQGRALEPGSAGAPAEEPARELSRQAPGARSLGLVAESRSDAKKDKSRRDAAPSSPAPTPPADAAPAAEADESLDKDLGYLEVAGRFFRKTPATRELAESNYYHVRRGDERQELIPVNAFWVDYAAHRSTNADSPFITPHVAAPTHSFTEMLCALAVLDLPFAPGPLRRTATGEAVVLEPNTGLVAFCQEVLPTTTALTTPILVGQNLYRDDDRFAFEGSERRDKFVSGELIVNTVYGCQVIVTNPTSSVQRLDLLLQIPRGAIPVQGGFYTRGRFVELAPYATTSIEYRFYFPRAGQFAHYPVQVSQGSSFVCAAEARTLAVVARPTQLDTSSWNHISQQGTPARVLDYLEANNVERLDLALVAWRLRDPRDYQSFGEPLRELLRRRHSYDSTLWSYSLLHNDRETAREYLRHAEDLLMACGSWFDSDLVTTRPVERYWYEHLEYDPLVNARAHRFGAHRTIDNAAFHSQYERFLEQLCQKRQVTAEDRLAASYYLLLQDRIEEAAREFARVDRARLATHVQYDYLAAYSSLFSATPEAAREIAQRHADYPVEDWRERFRALLRYLDEVSGVRTETGRDKTDDASNADLAAAEPSFDVRLVGQQVLLDYRNLASCRVNYYRMDIELLFSSQPFAKDPTSQQQGLEPWAAVRPALSTFVELPVDRNAWAFELPEPFRSANVIVEVVAAGKRRSQTRYASQLNVQLAERYGQLRVFRDRGGPLPQTYVKVYARNSNGATRFFKDGYTDLLGRFDYAALSVDELDAVDRFSVLVLHDTEGAQVLEVEPPKQ